MYEWHVYPECKILHAEHLGVILYHLQSTGGLPPPPLLIMPPLFFSKINNCYLLSSRYMLNNFLNTFCWDSF